MSIGRNAIVVTVASLSGQLLQLAALPFISHYASPAAFGTFALFAGLCALLAVFAGLRYDAAIIVAASDRQARAAVALMIALGAAASLLAFFVGLATALVGGWFDDHTSVLLACSGCAYLAGNTVVRAASNWLVRCGRFVWVGINQFVPIVSTVIAQIILLISHVEAVVALAGGFALGQVIGAAIAVLGPGRKAFVLVQFRPTLLFATARYFVKFPRYMVLYGLNTQIRDRAVQILIGWSAGVDTLGKFSMTQRLVGTPQGFLSAGIGPALMNYARHNDRESVAATSVAIMEFAWLLLAPLWTFAAFNAKFIFDHFFGQEWSGVALVFQTLTLPYLLICCTSFVDRLYEFYGHQRAALHIEVAYTVALLTTLTALVFVRSEKATIFAFSSVCSVYSLIWTYRTFVVNELPRHALVPGFFRVVAVGVLMFASNALIVATVDNFWGRGSLALVVIAIAYLAYWHRFGARKLISSILRG